MNLLLRPNSIPSDAARHNLPRANDWREHLAPVENQKENNLILLFILSEMSLLIFFVRRVCFAASEGFAIQAHNDAKPEDAGVFFGV